MIFEKVRNIISSELGISEDKIQMNTAIDEIGVDSLEFFQLIIDLEDKFQVRIEDTEDIKTIKDLILVIEERVGGES